MANINNIEDVKNLESWDVGVTIHRTNPFPLDNSSYFTNIEDAQDYATNGATSHVGQELFVITEVDGGTVVDTYVIQNSDGLLEKLATKSITDKLSANIAAIFDDVRGGVNYKGHINLDETAIDSLPKYPADMALSSIFAVYFNIINPTGEYVENKSLNNGWLYNITTSKEYVTSDGISLENNDYIIIHNHGLSSVDVSALTRDNIDLIEAVLDDYVRLYQFSSLSVRLSTEIEDLSAGLSVDAREKASALSGEIESLSAALSGDVDSLSTHLSTEIIDLSTSLSGDIDSLSARLSTEIIDLSASLSGDIDALSNHLSTDINSLSDALSGEIRLLSTALSTEINNLSTNLSTDVDSLSGKISAEVNNLSDALSGEVRLLSTALSNEITSLSEDLSSTVNSNYVHISGDSGIGVLSLTSDLSAAGNLTLGSDATTEKLQVKNNGKIDFTIHNDGSARLKFEISLQEKSGTLALTSDVEALSNSISATAHKEVEDLSTSLSTSVNGQFVHLSGDEGVGPLGLSSTLSVASNLTLGNKDSSYKFNIDSNTGKLKYTVGNNDLTSTTYDIDLQSKDGTIALTSDVQDLSTTIDELFILSSEAVELIQGTLLDRINVLSNDISSNAKEILSNDADINYLSALLSTVADDHYYKTLSAIYHDNCPDNLLITDHSDEPTHKNYVLVFKYGTLVLSSIS